MPQFRNNLFWLVGGLSYYFHNNYFGKIQNKFENFTFRYPKNKASVAWKYESIYWL